MAKILVKGEAVYECDICKRRTRVPANKTGIDIVQRCIITANCQGKLHRITLTKDINDTPAFPPEVVGVQDWFQRQVLYTHKQPVQSAKWVVQHDLENKPNVYVYVNRYVDGEVRLTETAPKEVRVVDLNRLEVHFDQAEQGLVQCIALSSRNVVNPNASAGVAQAADDLLVTNEGEITIATLVDHEAVDVPLVYDSAASAQPVIIEYLGLVFATAKSPWAGCHHVMINGRRYVVRSFNIIQTPTAPEYFRTGMISDGSTVTFKNVDRLGTTLILLSKSPHAAVDRMYDKYIDAATLVEKGSFYYNAGAMYVQSQHVRHTYPPIIVVA
jgi:hypothetical protein